LIPLLLIAVLVGVLLPVQAGVNAQLRLSLSDPLATALVSFVVGTLGLGILTALSRVPVPLAAAWARSPWWHWIGGLLGAVYIAAAVILAPRLGAAALVAAVVAGQMVASIVLDHFGWVGFAEHPVNGVRILGAALVIIGVLLVQR
jgi:bacterial/archaeal transporter family-2 protein